MDESPGIFIPPSSLRQAIEHCKRYAEDKYRGITLLGEPNSLSRKGCEIARNAIDQKSIDEQNRDAERDAAANDHAKTAMVRITDTELIQRLTEDTSRRVFITGEGGLGKSELTRLIAFRLAEHFLDQPHTAALPLFVELSSLSTERDYDTLDDVLAHCLARDEHHWVRPYIDASRVAFCLDGLDELPVPPNVFYAALAKYIGHHKGCTFVLAGRPGSLPTNLMGPDLFAAEHRYELQPLTDWDVRRYVAGFFTELEPNNCGELTARMQAAIAAGRSSLRPLIYTPFILSLACTVYRNDRQLPINPAELFDRGIRRLFDRRRSLGAATLPKSDDLSLEALSTLAAYALAAPAPNNAIRLRFETKDAHRWLSINRSNLAAIRKSLADDDDEIADLLNQLAPASGVLVTSGSTHLAFTNRVAAEFLAAKWICRHGYPAWPYESNVYTPRRTDLGVVTAIRDRQIMDWFGDHAWTRQRSALVQAVRFELARVEPVASDRLPKAGTNIALCTIRWLDAAIDEMRVGSEDALDLSWTLTNSLFRAIQPIERVGSSAISAELEAILRVRFDSYAEWWLSEDDVDVVALLPSFLSSTPRKMAIDALASVRSYGNGKDEVVQRLASALATAFGGDSSVRNSLITALSLACRGGVYNNCGSILWLSEALASGFGGDSEAKKALLETLAIAASVNATRVRFLMSVLELELARTFDHGNRFEGTRAVLPDKHVRYSSSKELELDARRDLAKLIEVLEIVLEQKPTYYENDISWLASKLASDFAGNSDARNAIVAALVHVGKTPAENGMLIKWLCKSLVSGFDDNDKSVRTALIQVLAIARADPTENQVSIHWLADTLAVLFRNDADVRIALVEALDAARIRAGENAYVISCLTDALAYGFGGDATAAKHILLLHQGFKLETYGWHPFVVIAGARAALEEWPGLHGEAWNLPNSAEIIHELDPNEPVESGMRQAVLVAPREQIRRGLPIRLLSLVISDDSRENQNKAEKIVPRAEIKRIETDRDQRIRLVLEILTKNPEGLAIPRIVDAEGTGKLTTDILKALLPTVDAIEKRGKTQGQRWFLKKPQSPE